MRLKWLEVRNRERNWNKVKNFIFVESKLELCQLKMLIFIYKLKCQSSLINLFHFFSVNLVCYELKRRQKYYFRTFIFSNSQIEILVSFSMSKDVNVNMSFPNSNFEGNLCVIQVILTISRLEKWMLDITTYIMQKILNFSYEWRLEFFVKKWNMYEAHIFPRQLQQTCSLETTPLCLNIRLRVNKIFQNSH